MKVKVTQPVQLVYAGEHHTLGDVVDVPDRIGADWVRQHWAEAVEDKPSETAAPRKRSG
jgi:hypothetical protein